MPGTIYLIRNGGLYKIGVTNDLDRRMKELEPDEILAAQVTAYYLEEEKELHKRYKHCRVPQTEYFRLTQEEVKEVLYELTGDGVPYWVNEAKADLKDSWFHTRMSWAIFVGFIATTHLISYLEGQNPLLNTVNQLVEIPIGLFLFLYAITSSGKVLIDFVYQNLKISKWERET